MARRRRTHITNGAKRGTFITPRASGYARYDWPSKLSPFTPFKPLKPYSRYVVRNPPPINRGLSFDLIHQAQLPPRGIPRQRQKNLSGMHDTYFKRPTISPYGVWAKGLGYLAPQSVKVCVQRKIRREAVFATTGGGRIRRKSTNQRTLRSQIGCK